MPKTASAQSYRAGAQFQQKDDLLFQKKNASNPNLGKKIPNHTLNSNGSQLNGNKFLINGVSKGDQQTNIANGVAKESYSFQKTPKIHQNGLSKVFQRGLYSPQSSALQMQQQQNGKKQNIMQQRSTDNFKKYFPSSAKSALQNNCSSSNNTNFLNTHSKLKMNNYFEEDAPTSDTNNNNNLNNTNSTISVNGKNKIMNVSKSQIFNQYKQMQEQQLLQQQQDQIQKMYQQQYQQQMASKERPPSTTEQNWKQNYLKNLKEYQKSVKQQKALSLGHTNTVNIQISEQNGNQNGAMLPSPGYNGNNMPQQGNTSKITQQQQKESHQIQIQQQQDLRGKSYNNNTNEQYTANEISAEQNGAGLGQFITKVNRGDNILGNMVQFNSPRTNNGQPQTQAEQQQQQQLQQNSQKQSFKIQTPKSQTHKSQQKSLLGLNQLQKSLYNTITPKSQFSDTKKNEDSHQKQKQAIQQQQVNSAQGRKVFHFPTHNKANSYSGVGIIGKKDPNNQNSTGSNFAPKSTKNAHNYSHNVANQNDIRDEYYEAQNSTANNNNTNPASNVQNRIKIQNEKIKSQQLLSPKQKQQGQQTLQLDKLNKFVYYMSNLEKVYKVPQNQDYFSQLQREHFVQSCQGILYSNFARPANPRDLQDKKVVLRKRNPKFSKTIIFDLDETLIHCNESINMPHDVKLSIKFPQGEVIEAGINIRPYAREILKELSEQYEIVVFTASHSCYAKTVIDYLDPQQEWVHHKFYREHCIQTPQGVYIKDLRIFSDRNMEDMVIVDNAAYSFSFQVDNGIPILPFYHHKEDKELKHLLNLLKPLKSYKDVRDYLKQIFKLQLFNDQDGPGKVYEKLFGKK